MTKNEVTSAINELRSYNGKWRGKYLRNLRLYLYSMNVSLDQVKEGNLVGYWSLMDNKDNYTSSINENIIQSCIDSLVSQLASKNTRPYVSTINGTYRQMQTAKQCQIYLDHFYDNQSITNKVTEAFRDACIFGAGFVYIDPKTKQVLKALPWQVMYRPAEDSYGNLTRVYYERKYYPTSFIPNYKGKEDYVTFGEYYDIINKVHATLINENITAIEKWDKPVLPITKIHYVNPVYGKDTTSIVDILYGIQMQLDDLYGTIKEAIRRNPAQTFVVPKGSDVKVTKLTNRTGQILTYNPIEGVSNPVTSVTPEFIASQYIDMVNMLKNDAYELVGISKLSAQSQKPQGLDSGKALKTMNDIESERFEVQYKSVINMYIEIAKKTIWMFDPDEYILPTDINTNNIPWGALQNDFGKLKIQFSGLDILSKDPSTKVEQLNQLISLGVISQAKAATFFDIPDIDSAYNYISNASNAVQTVINQCMMYDDYTIPDYIPLDTLKNEIVNTMLSLKAVENDENTLMIQKLQKLFKEADNKANLIAEQQNQQAIAADEQAFNQQLQRQVQTIQATTAAQAAATQNTNI